jgi:uncharacterized membrane protein YqhA
MFHTLLSMRLIMLFASFGATVGAILMFGVGGSKLLNAVEHIFSAEEFDSRIVTIAVMGSTDAFLFGIVLVIFAYAVTFGFVLTPPRRIEHSLPGWMRIKGVGELKHTLVEVILVYLIVDFATDLAETDDLPSWSTLVKPIAIVLIAAALRLFGRNEAGGKSDDEEAAGIH